jgi:hypothetical protein
MDRNLLGLADSTDAYYITGYPIQTAPPPTNGQVLAFENGVVDWITTVPGDIATISNIGSGQGLFAGISGGDNAQFYSLSSTNANIAVSLVGSNVDVNLNNNLSVNNITTTTEINSDGVLSVNGPMGDSTGGYGVLNEYLSSDGISGVLWKTLPTPLSIANLATQGFYQGTSGGVANFYGLSNTDGNVVISQSGNNVHANLNTSIVVPTITASAILSISNGLRDHTASTGSAGQYLASTGSGAQTLWTTPLLSLDADTLISSPTAGDSLIFSGISGKWQNTPAGPSLNIYNGDGTLSGNRNLYLDGFNLSFDGPGSVSIPAAMQAQYAEQGCVVASGSGQLALYVNSCTWDSLNTIIHTTGFNYPTLNAINFANFTHPSNCDLFIDCYLSIDAYGCATALQWKTTINGSGGNTGWMNLPQVLGNLSNPNSGQASFCLQGRIGHIAYNVFETRLIQSGGGGVSADGNLRMLVRSQDNSLITSTLVSQTPYYDGSINLDLQLQNVYNSKSFTFRGIDITTFGSQTFYWIPGQKIWLSASVNFNFLVITLQTVAFDFYINGVLLGYALGCSYSSGGDCNLNISNYDLLSGSLYMAGTLVSGNNTLTIGVSTSGGTLVTASRSYSVGVICAF